MQALWHSFIPFATFDYICGKHSAAFVVKISKISDISSVFVMFIKNARLLKGGLWSEEVQW